MEENSKQEFEFINGLLEQQKIKFQEKIVDGIPTEEKAELIGKINLIKFSQELLRRCFEYNVIPRGV